MSINLIPPRYLNSHWESVERGANRVNRTPDRSLWRIARDIYVADTAEQAREEALEGTLGRDYREFFFSLLGNMGRLDLMKHDPDMPDSDVTVDYLIDNVFIVGSPDEVVDKLQKVRDEVGGFGVLLTMGHEWDPREPWMHSVKLLKEEVVPRLS